MNTIWSFDLGKASIGEAVRDLSDHSFPHKESLLIPAEFGETRTAASRRRMMRTRQAHRAREAWLDAIWQAAGMQPLTGRRVEERDGKWQPVIETPEQKKIREQRLEREFPEKGDPTTYNSALLRIKLLRGEKLEPWQIYKALHSAIQKRGYGRVPWAAREELKTGKTEKQIDEELTKKDPAYKQAVDAWPAFKREVDPRFHFPCYYDAAKMKLWSPTTPDGLSERIDCTAESTRRVRFAREDVEREISTLACHAAGQLPALAALFQRILADGWTLRNEATGRSKTFPVVAKDIGAFLVHGPAGEPLGGVQNDFAAYLDFRRDPDGKAQAWKAQGRDTIHPGSIDDWMGATGQKTPRFDNRIVNDCALLDGHQVCNVAVRYDAKNKRPFAETLLASEVTFLMKLKNTLVTGVDKDRKLTVEEIRKIFAIISEKALKKPFDVKDYSGSVIGAFEIKKNAWGKAFKHLDLRPIVNHTDIKPPKTEGRSRFSRSALRLVRALILSGDKPSDFKRRLLSREPALLAEIGMDVLAAPPPPRARVNGVPEPQRRPHVLEKDLKFLTDLATANDDWAMNHIPEQRLDALEARHTDDGEFQREAAIREVIGSINDPIVRHRLEVFHTRLQKLQHGCPEERIPAFGVPQEIVLEFVRTDFMGTKAKIELAAFQKKREAARVLAREQAGKADALKYELCVAQGGICLYCGQPFMATALDSYAVEHIVPRKQNGPDAMVNYVLAHHDCNNAKGERTPFEWLRQTDGWSAYTARVESRSTELRNKKVQLLLREDAAELVQRYTALAETAWVSRLAQKIAGLHFGWRNGNDAEGNKRITVISGGLTARVRRKYRLNSLLAPCPPGEDPADWEAKADIPKNRTDDRHHALDAMVINFLPQWSRDANKEHFFRFPEPIQKNAQGFFRKQIDEVMPSNIAFEKPVLAETIYGGRREGEKTVIVQRVPLLALGMKQAAQGKSVFDLKYLRDQSKSVREPRIMEAIHGFLDEGHEEEAAWRDFCANLRLPRRDGSPGPRVLKVNVNTGASDEYVEMSKDQTGAYRKGKKGHRGQIVYLLQAPGKKGAIKQAIQVRPVYVFESRRTVEKKLREEHGEAMKVYGFFQSGCRIAVEREVAHDKKPLPAGEYLLNTVRAGGDVKLTTRDGKTHPDIPRYSLKNLISAGMRRVS